MENQASDSLSLFGQQNQLKIDEKMFESFRLKNQEFVEQVKSFFEKQDPRRTEEQGFTGLENQSFVKSFFEKNISFYNEQYDTFDLTSISFNISMIIYMYLKYGYKKTQIISKL